jgi:hypothetical protein
VRSSRKRPVEVPFKTFGVRDLRALAAALPPYGSRSAARLSATLYRREPDFCQIIGEVALDPRCAQPHSFCTMFCALALTQAERWARRRLPKFARSTLREVVGLVAQRQEACIGKRACGYPGRIRQHALRPGEFDEDDSQWLGTTISAFLFLIERSLASRALQSARGRAN